MFSASSGLSLNLSIKETLSSLMNPNSYCVSFCFYRPSSLCCSYSESERSGKTCLNVALYQLEVLVLCFVQHRLSFAEQSGWLKINHFPPKVLTQPKQLPGSLGRESEHLFFTFDVMALDFSRRL